MQPPHVLTINRNCFSVEPLPTSSLFIVDDCIIMKTMDNFSQHGHHVIMTYCNI